MATAGHATMLFYARHGRPGLGIGMAYGALLKATSRACMAPVAIGQPADGHVSRGVVKVCFSSIAKDMAYRFRFYIIKAVLIKNHFFHT